MSDQLADAQLEVSQLKEALHQAQTTAAAAPEAVVPVQQQAMPELPATSSEAAADISQEVYDAAVARGLASEQEVARLQSELEGVSAQLQATRASGAEALASAESQLQGAHAQATQAIAAAEELRREVQVLHRQQQQTQPTDTAVGGMEQGEAAAALQARVTELEVEAAEAQAAANRAVAEKMAVERSLSRR